MSAQICHAFTAWNFSTTHSLSWYQPAMQKFLRYAWQSRKCEHQRDRKVNQEHMLGRDTARNAPARESAGEDDGLIGVEA